MDSDSQLARTVAACLFAGSFASPAIAIVTGTPTPTAYLAKCNSGDKCPAATGLHNNKLLIAFLSAAIFSFFSLFYKDSPSSKRRYPKSQKAKKVAEKPISLKASFFSGVWYS